MLWITVLAVLLSAVAENPNALTEKEKREGWQLLFDGKNLDGWRGYRMKGLPEAGWEIKDGLLKTVSRVKGRELITEQKFKDFDLKWEWRIAPAGNNGVKYFVTEDRPAAPGHEYQMIDDAKNPDGKVGPQRTTAAFYDVLPPAADKPTKPAGEWNQSEIVVRGNHVEHWLNGKKVVEYTLGSADWEAKVKASKFAPHVHYGRNTTGYIGLQDHGDRVAYRNIKIRVLP